MPNSHGANEVHLWGWKRGEWWWGWVMRVVYVTLQGHQLSEITIRVIQSSSGACHVIIMTAENSQKRGFYRVLPLHNCTNLTFSATINGSWFLKVVLIWMKCYFWNEFQRRIPIEIAVCLFRSAEFFRNSMNGVIRCRTYLSMCPFAKKLWADQIFVTCKKVHTYFISTLFEWPTLESFGISSFSRVSTSLNNCILFFSPCGCSMK